MKIILDYKYKSSFLVSGVLLTRMWYGTSLFQYLSGSIWASLSQYTLPSVMFLTTSNTDKTSGDKLPSYATNTDGDLYNG